MPHLRLEVPEEWLRDDYKRATGFDAKKLVGNLHRDAGAISRIDLAPHRAAVLEVDQYLKGFGDNCVGFLPIHVDDEADTATVVLELRIV